MFHSSASPGEFAGGELDHREAPRVVVRTGCHEGEPEPGGIGRQGRARPHWVATSSDKLGVQNGDIAVVPGPQPRHRSAT